MSINHSNCTHSDSVLKRTVVNKIKYDNHDNKNMYSARSVRLEIYAIVKKPLFLIMEALHSTKETVYIYQNIQESYPSVFVNLAILNNLCLFWEFRSVTLSLQVRYATFRVKMLSLYA